METAKPGLVQQSDNIITVTEGETPVILFERIEQVSGIAAKAVAFLRSGCPDVQILMERIAFARDEQKSHLSDCIQALKDEILLLKKPTEIFRSIPVPSRVFLISKSSNETGAAS